jgi:hypothetical protein
MARLPGLVGLFLAHPLQAYPIGLHLLRARSGAARLHSFGTVVVLASRRRADRSEVPVCARLALRSRRQRSARYVRAVSDGRDPTVTNDYRVDPMRDRWTVREAVGHEDTGPFNLQHDAAQAFAVLLAPWHWLTLEFSESAAVKRFGAPLRHSRFERVRRKWYVRTYPTLRIAAGCRSNTISSTASGRPQTQCGSILTPQVAAPAWTLAHRRRFSASCAELDGSSKTTPIVAMMLNQG